MATLRLVSGGSAPQDFRVDGKMVIVGRDESCDIVLRGTGISRRQCMLVLTQEGYRIEDLKSSNGTMLGREIITEPTLLKDGDTIVIVGHILEFQSADEVPAPVEGQQFDPSELPKAEEDYDSTEKMDPNELNRRLDKLLEEQGYSLDDE